MTMAQTSVCGDAIEVIASVVDSIIITQIEEEVQKVLLLEAKGAAYDKQARVIDDLNDLTYEIMTFLPQCCWLELDGSFPAGQFYCPGLTVNKLLNITAVNLTTLLGTLKGRNLPKHVVFHATSSSRLARTDKTQAIFIFVDSTGVGPSEGPGEAYFYY